MSLWSVSWCGVTLVIVVCVLVWCYTCHCGLCLGAVTLVIVVCVLVRLHLSVWSVWKSWKSSHVPLHWSQLRSRAHLVTAASEGLWCQATPSGVRPRPLVSGHALWCQTTPSGVRLRETRHWPQQGSVACRGVAAAAGSVGAAWGQRLVRLGQSPSVSLASSAPPLSRLGQLAVISHI